MIEWKSCTEVPCSQSAELGNLQCLVVPGHEPEFRWYVLARLDVFGTVSRFPLVGASGHTSPTLDAAKLAAETFAREWVAAQAAALGDGWVSVGERLPENDGWYHVAVHDYKGRYPRHAVAEFTRDRFWIADDDGEGDSVFAWRQPALPPLPVAEVKE